MVKSRAEMKNLKKLHLANAISWHDGLDLNTINNWVIMPNKRIEKSSDIFIHNANILHENKYSYDEVQYINNNTGVNINCSDHGLFKQLPSNHTSGRGCPKCKYENFDYGAIKQNFIKKAKLIHGEKYNYENIIKLVWRDQIPILCPIHGEFLQLPNNHLAGKGCGKCGRIQGDLQRKYTKKQFIEKAVNVHGNLYDYSNINYSGIKNNITILCKKHGKFNQTPDNHLSGKGCKKCSTFKTQLDV